MIGISSEYAFDKRHPFDFKLLDSEELFRLSAVRRTGFVVNEATGTSFLKLLEAVLKSLLCAHEVYFVYAEHQSQPKSRLRSYRKMMYGHRKHLGADSDLTECEFDCSAERSVMLALLRIKEGNLAYTLSHLIDSRLAFGLALPKGGSSFTIDAQDYLASLFQSRLEGQQNFHLNFLKAVLKPPQAVKYCFRIRSTGRDEEILDFFHLDSAAEADPILALSRTYQAMGNN